MKQYYFFIISIFLLFGACKQSVKNEINTNEVMNISVEEMGIEVTLQENRGMSFTNKESAYYFMQSYVNNHVEHAWFAGWTVAATKVVGDYTLFLNSDTLLRETGSVTVFPHKSIRVYPSLTETFTMFDKDNILEIEMTAKTQNNQFSILLPSDNILKVTIKNNIAFCSLKNSPEKLLAIAPISETAITNVNSFFTTDQSGGGFFLVFSEEQNIENLILDYRANRISYKNKRMERMNKMLNNNTLIVTGNDSLDLALRWIVCTMDQLVSHQRGYGIYAGLPWFNEYWGRDSFIALSGAVLVTGQFEMARNILLSFAEYQDTVPTSKYFGRVPNIVKINELNYHTTDGTPRFIIQMGEYIQYSGDTSLIPEVYATVKRSIDGALLNWTDEKGYLLHENADTWMDARRASDLQAFSPRGTRANDIQALWLKQLQTGIYFATQMGDNENVRKWTAIAEKVQQNFLNDFFVENKDFMADRLTANNEADFLFRPNQLYALDFVTDEAQKMRLTRKIWENLVYPWGVASLSQLEENFHPFHLSWENYHKDAAYHNGAIWLWLNGEAMQRMIEAEQEEIAWKLFQNMNKQALTRGAVGCLAENSDAYPRLENELPKLTGTYLQAWSNSEHLRIWYQYFLGIKPELIHKVVHIRPRIPQEIKTLTYNSSVGKGKITGTLLRTNSSVEYTYSTDIEQINLELQFKGFASENIQLNAGDVLKCTISDNKLELKIVNNNNIVSEITKQKDENEVKRIEIATEIFEGTDFCRPDFGKVFKAMQQNYSE